MGNGQSLAQVKRNTRKLLWIILGDKSFSHCVLLWSIVPKRERQHLKMNWNLVVAYWKAIQMYCMKSQILTFWNFYRSDSCPESHSITQTPLWNLLKMLDLSYWSHRFAKIDVHGFVKVVLCFSRPLPNKTLLKLNLKFDQDFKDCWSCCFAMKLLNESEYLGLCAFGNVLKVWRRINSVLLVPGAPCSRD